MHSGGTLTSELNFRQGRLLAKSKTSEMPMFVMTKNAMITDLIRAEARALKMPSVARNVEAPARQARAEGSSVEDYLHEILAAEQLLRARSA